ncbi:hypothetical protein MES5069_190040 [Mesorhizobium escarrei]|uniref:Uncharacterized protein n=1 Tax=Mesorhizobium escarrei TaxID=666018 RepID=A0ABN8JKF4_9HYPH|nr:hypothetical protein MES5069_190040 [Mesorhizobium escarrei]
MEEMRQRVARYRREPVEHGTDYSIGGRILEPAFFWPRALWIPIADGWALSIVVGKSFDADMWRMETHQMAQLYLCAPHGGGVVQLLL